MYSGRSEELVGPLLELFTAETGIEVNVRYGDTAEMAALILTEGSNSPADLYFGQDAGALGALAARGRLVTLPEEFLDQVPPALRSTKGEWIGWAPTNGSFQAFVTALRVLEGEDRAQEWLEGIVANRPEAYANNTSIVEAVAAGEVQVGFTNHYYLYRFLAENPNYAAANKYYSGGDPGALINVAGAGVINTSDNQQLALRLIEFLLSDTAQTYFAQRTYEIPVVEGITPAAELPDLDSLTLPELDLDGLEDLEGTLELLTRVGAL